jgi:hypothetical protein
MWQLPIARLLTAGVIAGILGVSGVFLTATVFQPEVSVSLEPSRGTILIGETFTVSLVVDSEVPTNVFKGVLQFDPNTLVVESIDYNTSIANLWAEAPWYSNGAGTINFIGGTTQNGGFVGTGTLITVTFKSTAVGEAKLHLSEVTIMKHDGIGNEVTLNKPIDALFAVSAESLSRHTLLQDEVDGPDIHVVRSTPHTDLNNDGTQTMADVSIFMSDFVTQNLRSDFSGDGQVDLDDVTFFPIL